MVRRLHALLLAACVVSAACLSGALGAEAEAEWPPSLLEHTAAAMASGKWAPEPRTRLEKLALHALPRQAESLGSQQTQPMFFGGDRRNEEEVDYGRAAEPNSHAHFDVNYDAAGIPLPSRANWNHPIKRFGGRDQGLYDVIPRAARDPCGVPIPGVPCLQAPPKKQKHKKSKSVAAAAPVAAPAVAKGEGDGPAKPAPLVVPPPPKTSRVPTPPRKVPPHAKKLDFFPGPSPMNPVATPKVPSCGDRCDPDDSDVRLVAVPPAPLSEEHLASIGNEGPQLTAVLKKLHNRESWLRAQKLWLSKAVEAAAVVKEQLEQAIQVRDQVAHDLDDLKHAQDSLSIKFKAHRLKWAFKDRKITLDALKERFEALEHAKQDVSNRIREARDDVTVLENTLGAPSNMVQMTPKDLDDPLHFLQDLKAEDTYRA